MGIGRLTIKVLSKDIMRMNYLNSIKDNSKKNISPNNNNSNPIINNNVISDIIKKTIANKKTQISLLPTTLATYNNPIDEEEYYINELINNMMKYNELTPDQEIELNNIWNNVQIDTSFQDILLQNNNNLVDNATDIILNANNEILKIIKNHPVLKILRITIAITSIYCVINNMSFIDGVVDIFNKDTNELAIIAKTIIATNMNEIKQLVLITNETIDILLPNNTIPLKNDNNFRYIIYILGGFLVIIFIIIVILVIMKITSKDEPSSIINKTSQF